MSELYSEEDLAASIEFAVRHPGYYLEVQKAVIAEAAGLVARYHRDNLETAEYDRIRRRLAELSFACSAAIRRAELPRGRWRRMLDDMTMPPEPA